MKSGYCAELRFAHRQAQASKSAELELFHRIMDTARSELESQCTNLNFPAEGKSDDELRRQLLGWHRQRMP